MSSRLASETIRITLDGTSAELVPTLRAALNLARRYGTYSNLIGKLSEGSIDAIVDTIVEGSGHRSALPAVLAEVKTFGVIRVMALIVPPLVDFVISLAGPRSDDNGKNKATGAPLTFEAFHEHFFEVATGWLGWTPAEAWAATPSEIIAAQKGRVAMLREVVRGITGVGDGTASNSTPREELTLDEQALAVFGGRKRKRAA